MAKSKGRLLAELLASDGKVKESKSALDISGGKLAPSDIPVLPNSKLENSSISIAGHSTSLGGSVTLDTGDIGEHTNYKYYTEGRARGAISASSGGGHGSVSYNASTGALSVTGVSTEAIQDVVGAMFSSNTESGITVTYDDADGTIDLSVTALNTGNVTEGSNLYYTDARARAAISATGSLSYNSTTGVMSFTMPAQNTSNITEGSNLYYTNARADARITNALKDEDDMASDSATHIPSQQSVKAYVDAQILTKDNTDEIAEGSSNLYYTTSRANSAIDARVTQSMVNALGINATHLNSYTGGSYALKASPALTGTPTAPTAAANTNTTQIATTAFVQTELTDLIDGAPGTLDTLNELAAAINDDANYNTTLTTALATKLPKSGGAMTGAITTNSTFDGRNVSVDGAKLDGIATSANNYVLPFTNNSANWNTAYGWGNHASAGYYAASNPSGYTNDQTAAEILTAIKTVDGSGSGLDADTVDSVQLDNIVYGTYKGTFSAVTMDANSVDRTGLYSSSGFTNRPSGTGWTYLDTKRLYSSDNNYHKQFSYDAYDNDMWTRTNSGGTWSSWYKMWNSYNDGAGSGLDADLLDGQHGSYYLNAANFTGTAPTGSPFLSDFVHLGNASGSGYSTDDGNWGSRLNVSSTVHAKIEVSQQANSMRSAWYAHTGQTGIKFGTTTSHVVDFITAGTVRMSIPNNSGIVTTTGQGTLWGASNDGSGSGLDADLLDGMNSSSSVVANTIVARQANGYIYANHINFNTSESENPTINSFFTSNGDGWSRKSTKAHVISQLGLYTTSNDGSGSGLDADLLDGQHGSYYAPNSSLGNYLPLTGGTLDNGTSTTLSVKCDDGGTALVRAGGDSQGTGVFEVTQDNGSHGGGMSYNGDGSPSWASGETADHVTFYRINAGTRTEVFHYPYSSNVVNFNSTPTVGGVNLLTAETLSSTNTVTVTGTKYWQPSGSATSPLGGGGGASLQAYTTGTTAAYMAFHRSGAYAINWGLDTSNTMVLGGWSSSTTVPRMSIGTNGLMVTAGQGNLWGAGNDGSGSGLDADLFDGVDSPVFFKSPSNVSGWQNNNANFSVRGGDSDDVGLHMEQSNGTFGFQLYSASGTYGFLDAEWGGWDIQKARNGTFKVDEGAGLKRVLNEANWSSYISIPSVGNGTLTVNTSGSASGGGTFTANQSGNTTITITGATIPTSLPANGGNADTVDNLHAASFLRSDADDSFSGGLTSTSRDEGIFGTYNSNYTDHIWSMGTGYKNHASGTNFGNLYGLAYKHTNNSTGGNMGGSHQVVWCHSGDPRGAIGYDYVWHASGMRVGSNNVWHQGNDGSGSGLDADLLDGQDGSYYAPNSSLGNYVHKNANTMTGTSFKMGFHSGGGGTTFAANHYSMGVDYANGSWSSNHYSDLIIGYHTGIRIGAAYDGVRFYNNSPTTDTNNTGNGNGSEALLMTIGGHAGGTGVIVNNALTVGGVIDVNGGHGGLNITSSSIVSSASSTWTGDPGGAGKIQYHSNRWYIVSDSSSNRIVQFRRNGSDKSWIDNDGKFQGTATNADAVGGVGVGSLLRSDTADTFTGTITMGTQKALVANNYGRGVYGLYSSTNHQHVWSMGTSYNLADNGGSVGNLYGLSYTHTNVGTGYGGNSAAGLGHQLNGRANGTLQWALGDGMWSSVTGSVWGASNDGSGSGLDADLLDGLDSSAFARLGGVDKLRLIPNRWFATEDADNNIDYYQHNYAKAHLGNTYKYTTSRPAITSDSSYWIGSMGWGTIDLNTIFSYGSGFWDSWSTPGNAPSGTTHWTGLNALHYSANTGTAQYGMQQAMGAGNPSLFFVRGIWGGGFTSWRRIWNDGNDGSGSGLDADLLDGQHGSYYYSPGNPPSTDADTIDGRGFVNTGSNSSQNADSINSNGISYYTSGVSNFSGNATDGALFSQQYSTSWQHQIAGDYRSGQIALRGKNNGTWQAWRKVWDESNDGSGSGLSADNSAHVYTTQTAGTAGVHYPTFVSVNSSGNKSLKYDPGMMYDPSTNTLGDVNFKFQGTLTGNASTVTQNHSDGGGNYPILWKSGSTTYYTDEVFINAAVNSVQAFKHISEAGTDNGIGFWGSHSDYAIKMGNNQANHGTVTDYSMHFNMGSLSGRGFTFGFSRTGVKCSINALTGAILSSNNITAYSDIRVKDNIEVIPNALDKVKQISGYTFTRTDVEDKEQKYTGVIAQEVLKVLPEAVQLGATEEDTMAVAYGNMVGLMIEAIKELKSEVDELKKQLKVK